MDKKFYCCGCGRKIIIPKDREIETEGNESDLYCNKCMDDDGCFKKQKTQGGMKMKCEWCGCLVMIGENINPFRKSYRCAKCGKKQKHKGGMI